jgi:hypothetical protein
VVWRVRGLTDRERSLERSNTLASSALAALSCQGAHAPARRVLLASARAMLSHGFALVWARKFGARYGQVAIERLFKLVTRSLKCRGGTNNITLPRPCAFAVLGINYNRSRRLLVCPKHLFHSDMSLVYRHLFSLSLSAVASLVNSHVSCNRHLFGGTPKSLYK